MSISRPVLILVLLPLILPGVMLAQVRTAPVRDANGIVFMGMFQSDSDVEVNRTPCQWVRDLFDHTGEAKDVRGERPAVCDKVFNVITGGVDPLPEQQVAVRAAKIVADSRGRIVFTEPRSRSVHILDFAKRKYIRIDGSKNDRVLFPYGVASDADDNVYVTDSRLGLIAVFNAYGKFKRYIGDFKGEHAFEQPNSIAIDRASGRIYLTDTIRQFVLIFDRKGKKLASIGKRGGGSGPAEFRVPTEVALHDQELFVLDKRNRRIQIFSLEGRYKRELRTEGVGTEAPKGMAIDTQGRIFVLLDIGQIEAFSPNGQSLFRFGTYGSAAGEFKDARGIYIDSMDRLYVCDTGNERVQVFQITNRARSGTAVAGAN